MKYKEAGVLVATMLAEGASKTLVFNRLSGHGVSDRRIAHLIASTVDPKLLQENKGLIKAVLVIAYLQVAIGILVGFGIGLGISIIAGVLFAAGMAAFLLLFVWGFRNNKALAYNATLFLTIMQIPKLLPGFSETPIENTIAIALNVGLFAFIGYVRQRLFPDFQMLSPRKVKGVYVFSS